MSSDATDRNWNNVQVDAPEFRFYRNGELLRTVSGRLDPNILTEGGYSYIPVEEREWTVDCEDGDHLWVAFFCRDEYGLGYEFYIEGWTAGEWSQRDSHKVKNYAPPDIEYPILTWE